MLFRVTKINVHLSSLKAVVTPALAIIADRYRFNCNTLCVFYLLGMCVILQSCVNVHAEPTGIIWHKKKELRVKFLDEIPISWTYSGRRLNCELILKWANEWSSGGAGVVPRFVVVHRDEEPSDIRVAFVGE
jgi:hypothetical protein